MWSKFGNSSISVREVIITSILKRFDKKNRFFEEWSWFKFDNLGLAQGTNFKFYTSMAKRVKSKSQKVLGANSYVCISYRRKTGRGASLPPLHSPFLNRVKEWWWISFSSTLHRSILLQLLKWKENKERWDILRGTSSKCLFSRFSWKPVCFIILLHSKEVSKFLQRLVKSALEHLL